jgi:hypothetical protein
MRKPLVAALFLALIVATSAFAARLGTVTTVNGPAGTFSASWSGGERIFKVTSQTTFWIGKKRVSIAELRPGTTVIIRAHEDGADRVADRVLIQGAAPR